jgi:mRNA interferase MazF
VSRQYVPEHAELVWLDLNPQAGHEQAGGRPALVLSARSYNRASGFAVVCPVTNRSKGYPFEVTIPAGCGATGVIIADQVRSVDWIARRAARLGAVPSDVIEAVKDLIAPLLGF